MRNRDPGSVGLWRTETYAELRLDLVAHEQTGYVWLLFSADSLRRAGTVAQLLERSVDYAADLGARLRDRIYKEIILPFASVLREARPKISAFAAASTT